ncbi:hypothetical protein [Streptomyces sp. NPDC012510]|uniref:hypothetical protein n=1 Tax=Streptomyces sp. NPDC012510 TaxID=3364838 RepID=UPI0036E83EBF
METSELLVGTRGAQIAGRFTLVPTSPFPYGDEWKGLIATMEETLILHDIHRAAWSNWTATCTTAPTG